MLRVPSSKEKESVALLCAVARETEGVLGALSGKKKKSIGPLSLVTGRMMGLNVVTAATGVGKVNAAAVTALLLQYRRVSLVIALGIGGAFPGSGLLPGALALASEEIFPDEGSANPNGFRSIESLGFPLVDTNRPRKPNTIPLSKDATRNAGRALHRRGMVFREGPFLTVSTATGTDAAAARLRRRYRPVCESMEGGAVAQICVRFGVPVIGLRAISNAVGDRRRGDWNIPLALERLTDAARCVLRDRADGPGR